jgi:hypothetical protein
VARLLEAAAWFGKLAAVWANEKNGVGKREKGNARFSNPAYIRRLTDEYRRARNNSPVPHIFIGRATPPTNIWGRSKSNQTVHIFIGSWPKLMNVILYSSVLGLMNII